MCVCVCVCTYNHTYIHTYKHTYTHTHRRLGPADRKYRNLFAGSGGLADASLRVCVRVSACECVSARPHACTREPHESVMGSSRAKPRRACGRSRSWWRKNSSSKTGGFSRFCAKAEAAFGFCATLADFAMSMTALTSLPPCPPSCPLPLPASALSPLACWPLTVCMYASKHGVCVCVCVRACVRA